MMKPMPLQGKRRMIWVGLAIGLLLLIAIGWQVSGGPRGWTTHQARIEHGAAHPELQPRRFPADPSQVLDTIEQVADEHPRWKLVGHSGTRVGFMSCSSARRACSVSLTTSACD